MENESERRGKRVLVTGAAGMIGRAVCRELRTRGHRVRSMDRVQGDEGDDWVVADLGDARALGHAVAGMDVVVHLAATPHDDADFMTDLLPNNIVGTFNVFEAVRECGVKRLVVTSSIQVVNRLAGPGKTVLVSDGTGPTNHYGVTKIFAEQMGNMYAYSYDMSVVVVRPGWVPREVPKDMPTSSNVYLSRADAGRFYADCVESTKLTAPGFEVLFALSRTRGRPPYEMEPAKRLIGYEPRHLWPEGLDDPD